MRCHGCHNYDELIAKRPVDYLTAEQVIHRLQSGGALFDAVLLSGGEFLINALPEITAFLTGLRTVFDGPVVVFTNGTYPDKLQRLLDGGLIDGVHLDMKLPYHCLDPEDDRDIYEAVLGIAPSARYCRDILDSVELVIAHNSRLSQVRTVRYPMLDQPYFDQIRSYVDALNDQYGSDVPYYLNPYVAHH